jgi:hypothetical protein
MEQEDKRFCPNIKEEYGKIYDKTWKLNCYWCSIPMSQCDYWIARAKDKEIPTDNWRDYLLERK